MALQCGIVGLPNVGKSYLCTPKLNKLQELKSLRTQNS